MALEASPQDAVGQAREELSRARQEEVARLRAEVDTLRAERVQEREEFTEMLALLERPPPDEQQQRPSEGTRQPLQAETKLLCGGGAAGPWRGVRRRAGRGGKASWVGCSPALVAPPAARPCGRCVAACGCCLAGGWLADWWQQPAEHHLAS